MNIGNRDPDHRRNERPKNILDKVTGGIFIFFVVVAIIGFFSVDSHEVRYNYEQDLIKNFALNTHPMNGEYQVLSTTPTLMGDILYRHPIVFVREISGRGMGEILPAIVTGEPVYTGDIVALVMVEPSVGEYAPGFNVPYYFIHPLK